MRHPMTHREMGGPGIDPGLGFLLIWAFIVLLIYIMA